MSGALIGTIRGASTRLRRIFSALLTLIRTRTDDNRKANVLIDQHHVFRHVKKTWMEGDLVDFKAFRLRQDEETGRFLEEGLSVNWVEYFQRPSHQEAVAPLVAVLEGKGREVRPNSRFALLNVGALKTAAASYTPVTVTLDAEPNDPSHSLVKGYEAYNDQVALAISHAVITTYAAKPPKS